MKHLTVTAAIIVENNEILCMQRKESKFDYISYKFEFPGGKVEPGESYESALEREIKEEMNLDLIVEPKNFYMMVNFEYPDFSITMHCYKCHINHRNFNLNDHHDHFWLKSEKLDTLDWAPADWPIVRRLMEDLD